MNTFFKRFLFTLAFFLYFNAFSVAAPYDIGTTNTKVVYVDPKSGNDSHTGASPSTALRTLDQAWRNIPANKVLTQGFDIRILPGELEEDEIPNYLENRIGSRNAPIIIRAANGAGTVTLKGDLNVFGVRYLYLLDLTINSGGDAFHCEQCDHLLIRGGEYNGGNRVAHETVKVNQSQYVYIEQANIHGADDNAIDFVAVQYASIYYNRIHDSEDWCTYVKGGSAYITLEGNEVYDCGTGGVTAGQGTGLEFMTSPWIHYEAQDIKMFNNIIHDTQGAGLGVNGGFRILMAYNTLYRVGQRSHTVEFVFGERSCDGTNSECAARNSAGGWGPKAAGGDSTFIGNKSIRFFNNLVYNPSDYPSPDQFFAIYGPRTNAAASNAPTAYADVDLQIKGNIMWSVPANMGALLGIEDTDEGCQPSNASCNATQIRNDNYFNNIEPQFISSSDFRPVNTPRLELAADIPNFDSTGTGLTPAEPLGDNNNQVAVDRGGVERSRFICGAYLNAESPSTPAGFPNPEPTPTPNPPSPTVRITKATCSPTKIRKGAKVTCSVTLSKSVKATGSIKIGTTTVKLVRKAAKLSGSARLNRKGSFVPSLSMSVTQSRLTRKLTKIKVA